MTAHPLFLYFLEKCLAIPTSFFYSFTSKYFFAISICLLFDDPIPSLHWWVGRNLNGISQCTISYRVNKDLILFHKVQLKPMKKSHSSGRIVSSGISDVVIASVHSEKTRLKQMIVMIIIMTESQEKTVFSGRQKLTSAMNQAKKVMVDFKFDVLYR